MAELKLNNCVDGRLFIGVTYEDRELIKSIKGYFDKKSKLWYISVDDLNKTKLQKIMFLKANDKYLIWFPKYIKKDCNKLMNRNNVLNLFDNFVKPSYCSCCGKALVPIGDKRKNGKGTDWLTRSTHKNCYIHDEEDDNFDVYTGKIKSRSNKELDRNK